MLGYGRKHAVSPERVKGISEVKLYDYLVIPEIAKISTAGVYRGLTATFDTDSKLQRLEKRLQLLRRESVGTLGRKSAPKVSHCNRSDAAAFFLDCNEIASK